MRSLYPVILSQNVQASKDFYTALFGFTPTFDAGWYVQLQQRINHLAQIGIVEQTHESVPENYRDQPRGFVLTLDYEDVTEIHEKVLDAGIPLTYPLTEEEWGQKHFMVTDPDNVLVDISQITQVPENQ